jgi:phosphatidate cytidylyltransferase
VRFRSFSGATGDTGRPLAAAEPGPAVQVSPPPAGKAGDLKLRIISALVLGPPVLLAAWIGGTVFEAVILLVAVLAVREWVRLVQPSSGTSLMPTPADLASHAAVLGVVGADIVFGAAAALWVALASTLLLFLLARSLRLPSCRLTAFVVPYIGLSCSALVWLRVDNGEAGLWLLLFLLLCIWATDVGGYVAGRSIGGPKLMPSVSPKKTWAGLIGGIVFAGAVGYGVATAADARQPGLAIVIAAFLAIAGQAGDLFESHIKRRSHVKDSGALIPGHGGLLDRIDGLIVAAPVLALLHATVGGWLAWW